MINPGQYKARLVKGTVQIGESEKGNLQLSVVLDIKDQNGASLGEMTHYFYFTDGAQAYSYERLRALGWKGKNSDELDQMVTLDNDNEVDVRVTQAEPYKAADGTMKMGVSKVEIITGGGRVQMAKPLDWSTFKARLRALGGPAGGGSSPPTSAPSGGGPTPPF